MDIGEETGQLHLNDFPNAVRKKLKIRAIEAGVTFRELVIQVLAEWCEGERGGRGEVDF